jgi:hypothetical protein
LNATAAERIDEHPYGWTIVAVATTCLALGFGANITVSVFMKPFEDEFGWFRADISMAYSMLTVGAAAGGIVWGSLSDRIGAQRIGFLGAFAISIGLIALRWQSALWQLYLLYFLIGALGFACLFTPMVALSGLWFSKRKGLAIGIVTAGGAIGQGLVPYVARLAITEVGWRDAALYLGLGYFVVLVPLMFLLRPPPAAGQASDRPGSANGNLWGLPHTTTIPWLGLAGPFCCICMAVPLVHLVPLGIDHRPHAGGADQQARARARQPVRQARSLQPDGLGQGPARARRDRGRRAQRRAEARPDRDRGDQRQHRHRPRHGLRAEGLSAGRHDGGELQRRAAPADALPRREGRADAGLGEGQRHAGKAVELAETHGWFLCRQFENEANADVHSRTTAQEILADFADAARLLGHRLRHRRHAQGRRARAEARAARHPDRRLRAGQLADARQRHRASRATRRAPGASHPHFRPHLMQGWSPDFIPKLTEDVVAG